MIIGSGDYTAGYGMGMPGAPLCGRQILMEMWGHQMNRCKYCTVDDINRWDSRIMLIVMIST
jgi:hypothetical protein